jgi:hypothetical protein
MKREIKKILGNLAVLPAILMVACNASKLAPVMVNDQAPVIVYKTKANYSDLVPVTMNESKDRILSYPAPGDLYFNGELALPLKLKKGYLLDRRGIGPNSVFTSYTYEEYSRMKAAPSIQELGDWIIDKEPFVSMYDCSSIRGSEDLAGELKRLIGNGFEGCKVLLKDR